MHHRLPTVIHHHFIEHCQTAAINCCRQRLDASTDMVELNAGGWRVSCPFGVGEDGETVLTGVNERLSRKRWQRR